MTMKKDTESTEMALQSGYAALANTDALTDAADDLAGLQLTFDRVKIPAGGATAFEIPGDNDDTEMVKEIRGIILLHHPAYAYYRDKYQGGSNPPDCGSFDGVNGTGDPGGLCAECPYNRFGSGEGQAKACKNRRMLYILMENEMFPVTLSLPTGSLKDFTKYVKRQLSKGRKLSRIVTRISLKKASSASGITYSQAVFSFDRMLNSYEVENVTPLIEQVKQYAANLTVASLAGYEETSVDPETGEIIEPLK
ncbi:hypothetical protein [Selenomonas bovis]|uniref:hypothetical protein n=1 Tax=Selenomonas bovis TaxID=416586 RepID=UPI00035CB83E|nr:hypothetical protein [Selenomonas bovis]